MNHKICEICDLLSEYIEIQSSKKFYAVAKDVSEHVSAGRLKQVEGKYPPSDIREGKSWPDDIVSLKFECTKCLQPYRLSVETYHGYGGAWQKLS